MVTLGGSIAAKGQPAAIIPSGSPAVLGVKWVISR